MTTHLTRENLPAFLLVDPGPIRKSYVINRLLTSGTQIYFAIGNRSEWISTLAKEDRLIRTEPNNVVQLINDVAAFQAAHGFRFAGVGTFEEIALCQTVDLARALGLPHPGMRGIWQSSRAKVLMREALTRSGVNQPRWAAVRNIRELRREVEKFSLPCVVKPSFGESSLGVKIIRKASDLETLVVAASECDVPYYPEGPHVNERPFLIEEYCPGALVSVDGIVQGGRINIAGVVETEILDGEDPILIANYLPPRLSEAQVNLCRKLAMAAVRQLEFEECGFHCECRFDDGSPKILEIAARMPGGQLPHAYQTACGIDFPILMHDVFLGKRIEMSPNNLCFVVQRGVFPEHEGVVEKVEDPFTRARPDWLVQYELVSSVGAFVNTRGQPRIPLFYFSVVGKNRGEVTQREAEVLRSVRYSY